MQKIFQSKKKNSGFTLVETLIAVSIFSVSILALMVVLSQGISDTTYAKQKIIAAYLAQEGIEYLRSMRDTYVLYNISGQAGWNAFNNKITETGADCDEANGCYFNDQNLNFNDQTGPITDLPLFACTSGCATLLYDETSGKYGYALGENSGYVRKIQVSQINANETKISSTISWTQGSGAYQITFSESLFNWIQ